MEQQLCPSSADSVKPETVKLQGNRPMTMKGCIFALAPTLERMRKRGFLPAEIIDLLKAKGVEVKEATLAKYLSEYRRQKGKRNSGQTATTRKRDTPDGDDISRTVSLRS